MRIRVRMVQPQPETPEWYRHRDREKVLSFEALDYKTYLDTKVNCLLFDEEAILKHENELRARKGLPPKEEDPNCEEYWMNPRNNSLL